MRFLREFWSAFWFLTGEAVQDAPALLARAMWIVVVLLVVFSAIAMVFAGLMAVFG